MPSGYGGVTVSGITLWNIGARWLSYTRGGRHPLVLSSGLREDGSVHPLVRNGTVVNVTASASGDPIEGARVLIAEVPGAYAVTDAEGAYAIESVPPGTYRVVVRAVGYTSQIAASVTFSAGATATMAFALEPAPPSPPPPPPPGEGEGEGEGEGQGGLTCNCPEQITVVVRAVSEGPNEHVELTANGTTYHSDESNEVSCVVTQGTPIRVKAIPSYEGFLSWSSTPGSPIHGCLFEDPPEQEDWFFVTDHDHGDLEIVAMFAKGSRVVNPPATGYGYVTIAAPGCTLTPSGSDTEITGPIGARVTVEVTGQNGYQWGHWTWEGATGHERYENAIFRVTNPVGSDTQIDAHVWQSADEHLTRTYRTITVTTDEYGYVTGFTCPSYINPSIDALLIVAEENQAGEMKVANGWKGHLRACASPGYEFESWYDAGGAPISTQDTSLTVTNVTADAAYSVAFRERPRLTVTTAVVDKDGNPYDGDEFETHCGGYVTRNDTHYDYATAQAVSLTAHAFISCGWAFHHWEEDTVNKGTANPFDVTMNNDKKVTAFFGPPIVGSGIIESITFRSDHGVLHSDNGTFADVGPLYTEPEWTSDGDNFPITHTKNTTITGKVKLDLAAPGRPFRLIGNGAAGCLSFTSGSTSTSTVSVTANEPLPNRIQRVSGVITWTLTYTDSAGGQLNLGDTGPHEVFVTYGSNTATGEVPTYTRMSFLVNAAMGENGNPHRMEVAASIADAIYGKHGGDGYWEQVPPGPLWQALDTHRFECEAARRMAVLGMMLLGTAQSDLRWTYDEGCHAYPSTDHTSGSGYSSNCVNCERPSEWCSDGDCTIPPGASHQHPEHDAGLPGVPCSQGDAWQLCLAGNGPMESFFKVRDDYNDIWWYIAAAPFLGPKVGSLDLGSEQDRAGRYQILDQAGYGQRWRWVDTVPEPHVVYEYFAPSLP